MKGFKRFFRSFWVCFWAILLAIFDLMAQLRGLFGITFIFLGLLKQIRKGEAGMDGMEKIGGFRWIHKEIMYIITFQKGER